MTLPAVRSGLIVSALAGAGALLGVPPAGAQASDPPVAAGRHVEASLVAEEDAVAPGRVLAVGIRLRMDAGWHTYWRNPGDSGLPTRVRWTLPPGFAAGDLQWPPPERFETGPIVSYGYSGQVLLPVEIRVPTTLAAAEVRLDVRVDWLECRDACLPGRAELTLALPVRATPRPGPAAPLLEAARRSLPAVATGWTITASSVPPALLLGLRPPPGEEVRDAYFYPLAPRVLEHGRPQTLERGGAGRYRLRLVRDPNGAPAERLAGVLVVETKKARRALAVDARVSLAAPARASRD